MCSSGFDGDLCQVWSEDKRRARKDYECDSCGGAIRAGREYINHRDLFDGYWSRARMCLPCERARKKFTASHRIIPNPGSLRETLEECVDHGDADSRRTWNPLLRAMSKRRAERVGVER